MCMYVLTPTHIGRGCAELCLLVCNNLTLTNRNLLHAEGTELLTALQRVCEYHMHYSSSIHVRKVALMSFTALYLHHHSVYSAQERKDFKNSLFVTVGIGSHADSGLLAGNISNITPDVMAVVQYGVYVYMGTKTSSEVNTLTKGYVKNLGLYYERYGRDDLEVDGVCMYAYMYVSV